MSTKGRAIAATIAIVLGAAALAGCEGYDPGMALHCVVAGKRGTNAASYDQFDNCTSTNVDDLLASGKTWRSGSITWAPNGTKCGATDGGPAYKMHSDPNNNTTPILQHWDWNGRGYSVTQGITKDACVANAEISTGLFNGTVLPINGLKTSNDIKILSRSGVYHLGIGAYVWDPATDTTWTLMVEPRPNNICGDSRLNCGSAVVFHGADGNGTNLIVLDGDAVGVPKVCVASDGCDFTNITIDWNSMFNWVHTKHPTWWSGLWAKYSQLSARIEVEVQTFDNGRLTIQQKNWNMCHC